MPRKFWQEVAGDTRNYPAPLVRGSMSRKPWQEEVVDVKEPMGVSHARQEGVKMDKTTLYQSQVNGSVGKFDRSSVKVIHGAGPKKEVSKIEGQEFLVNYRNTPHDNTGKYPRRLLRDRTFRTEGPAFIPCPPGKACKEASQADRKQKEQYKNYADKYRRARVVVVEQVRGPDIMARRGEKLMPRNVQERRKEAAIRDDSDKEEKDTQDDSDKEEKEGQ